MFKRILMNAADTGSGNGAALVEAPAVEQPQAEGAPNASSTDELRELRSLVSELTKSVHSLHAADRRAREGKATPKAETKDATNPTADDPSSLLALRDALDDTFADSPWLNKGQRALIREYVTSKKPHPSDVDGLVTDYLARAGLSAPATAATQPPASQATAPVASKPLNAQPASDRGSTIPSRVPTEEADLVTMSETDRADLIRRKGLVWYRSQLARQLKGRQIQLR